MSNKTIGRIDKVKGKEEIEVEIGEYKGKDWIRIRVYEFQAGKRVVKTAITISEENGRPFSKLISKAVREIEKGKIK